MSPVITRYLKDGVPIPMSAFSPDLMKMIPSQDKHRSKANLHRSLATNIYKTKDGRYYHTHGRNNYLKEGGRGAVGPVLLIIRWLT